MYYTVYQITNKVNGKIYIGCHKTKDLDDGYMGSGRNIGYAIEKYGIDNFEKDILFFLPDSESMYEKEKEIVNEEFVSSDTNYNIIPGGHGSWDYINSQEESRKIKNLRARKSADLVIKEKYGVSNPSQIPSSREKLRKAMRERLESGEVFTPPSFEGNSHSPEAKIKIGKATSKRQSGKNNSQYGTMWITNDIRNAKIKLEEPIPEGWRKGRI